MSEQVRRQNVGRDGTETGPTESTGAESPARDIVDELDSILDEIDEMLEENAEEFVKNYVQKGGQ